METCKQPPSPARRAAESRGFSIVELITVIGIIAVLMGVLAPNISQYIRNYKIRGEANDLATNLQKARNRAIMKNVNLGVSVVVASPTAYFVHLEDDQVDATNMTRSVARRPLDITPSGTAPNVKYLNLDPTQTTQFNLANDIRFATSLAECPTAPGGAFAPTVSTLRFSRLGAWCSPGAGCPTFPINPAPPAVNVIQTGAGGSVLCVMEPRTGLSRWITITAGGRIAAQP